ncbi:MAG: diacylglycerol/lipid kinase family protein [Acidimicrobiales bacterium]
MAEGGRRKRSGFRAGLIVGGTIGAVGAGAVYRRQLVSMAAGRRPHDREPLIVSRPVLIVNRWSGGGKAEKCDLASVAADHGIETVMLERGDDLVSLAETAVRGGADCLGMAGGDGSLGLVAGVAAEQGLPFFCVPVGTRNHFALDLGLDRNDPLAALQALTDGEAVTIDHGVINGRLFLNNVSLGVYPEAVKQEGYRSAKVATFLSVASNPDLASGVRLRDPEGTLHDNLPMVLVSNNPYVMSGPPDFGRRIRLDSGRLGVMALPVGEAPAMNSATSTLREWTASNLVVDSDREVVDVGIDGESIPMEPPLHIEVQRRGLRVLVPAGTRPGYRPSLRRHRPVIDHLVDLFGEPDS